MNFQAYIQQESWAPWICHVSVESSSFFARLYSWGYSLGFWRIPFWLFFFQGDMLLASCCIPPPYLNLLRDTLSASDISLFLLYFFQGILLCIPPSCLSLLGDTLCSFGVSPFLLIFLLGYNLASCCIPLLCHNLPRDIPPAHLLHKLEVLFLYKLTLVIVKVLFPTFLTCIRMLLFILFL